MFSAILAAAIAGQVPSAQSPIQFERASPAAPQTYILLSSAPVPVPTAPSVLISSPPVWDRALAATGQWLIARAAKHQHARAAQVVLVSPVTISTAPPMGRLVPSAQSAAEAAPLPPPPVPTPLLSVGGS